MFLNVSPLSDWFNGDTTHYCVPTAPIPCHKCCMALTLIPADTQIKFIEKRWIAFMVSALLLLGSGFLHKVLIRAGQSRQPVKDGHRTCRCLRWHEDREIHVTAKHCG